MPLKFNNHTDHMKQSKIENEYHNRRTLDRQKLDTTNPRQTNTRNENPRHDKHKT